MGTSARVAARCNPRLSVVLASAARVGMGGLMPCFMGDRQPGLSRLMLPISSLRRDIWLVVHRDLQHNAHVRAVLHFLAELIQRERSLISGEGLLAPMPEPTAPSWPLGASRKPRARTV